MEVSLLYRMWSAAPGTLVVMLACVVRFNLAQTDCHSNGPRNCSFQYYNKTHVFYTNCGWTLSNWSLERDWNDIRAVLDDAEGQLVSRLSCSTGGKTHCFKFRYSLSPSESQSLSVYIHTSDTDSQLLWTLSSGNGSEQQAEVPVASNSSFTIVIQAESSSDFQLYVDSIRYVPLQCGVTPTRAQPPLPAVTSTPHPTESTETSATVGTTTASTNSTTHASYGTSAAEYKTSAIVGGVVGVVVVVILVAVLVVVFRRRRKTVKTRFAAEKQEEHHLHVRASNNAAYNLDHGEAVDIVRVATDTGHHNHPLDNDTSPLPQLSDNYYSVIATRESQPSNETSSNRCKATCKSRRLNPASPPTETGPTEDSPYEIGDDTPDCTAHQPAGEAAAGLYHCLEDDPETQPQLDTTDPYLAPDTLDTDTYTPDTDTYTLDTDTYTLDTGTYTLDTDKYTLDSDKYTLDSDKYTLDTNKHTLDTGTYTLDTGTYTLAQHLYDVPPGARTSPPKPTHSAQESYQPSLTSQGDDGDYNSLDLGGRRRVVERGEGEGEGPGQVYSGLNEGDGDTYSEVNHHRRTEVIDDRYSHLQ